VAKKKKQQFKDLQDPEVQNGKSRRRAKSAGKTTAIGAGKIDQGPKPTALECEVEQGSTAEVSGVTCGQLVT